MKRLAILVDESFAVIKIIMSQNALLACPDFTKPFEIHADTSDFQLGSVVDEFFVSNVKITTSQHVSLAHLDFDKPFEICDDASDF